MNKKTILGIFLGWFLMLQSVWADCALPPENPFDEARDIYLFEIVAINPSNLREDIKIKILKVYKSEDIEAIKSLSHIGFSMRQPIYKQGTRYLIFDSFSNVNCDFTGSRPVSDDIIRLFEQQHQPIWIAPDIQLK